MEQEIKQIVEMMNRYSGYIKESINDEKKLIRTGTEDYYKGRISAMNYCNNMILDMIEFIKENIGK